MERRRVFGAETEYGLAATTDSGEHVAGREVAGEILTAARRRLVCVRSFTQGGVFLGSGARFYIDCDTHPEFCTPEVSTPEDAVAHIVAGERILASLADEVARTKGWRVMILRENVDYAGATFGRHESYLYAAQTEPVERHLLSHLVSRVIFGAGGFDPESPGIEFSLSPRSAYFKLELAERSTANRGILHRKSESLAGAKYKRFHVIFPGETLLSETGIYLGIATTALLVAMIDAGERPADALRLADPVAAMRAFSADPACRAEVPLERGGTVTAIAIQRHYLARVELSITRGRMPAWAPAVCKQWRSVLDRLELGPERAAGLLDWPTKYVLYTKHARERGFDRQALVFWTDVVRVVCAAITRADAAPMSCEQALAPDSPIRADIEKLTPAVTLRGETWKTLRRFIDLRREFHALDTRWGELGPLGVWASLEAAGSLSHRIVTPEAIEAAVTTPPPYGRARVRGEAIREAHAVGHSMRADWERVVDRHGHRALDLTDPFVSRAKWVPAPPAQVIPHGTWIEMLRNEHRNARADPSALQELDALARTLSSPTPFDLAEPSFRRALALLEGCFRPDHPVLASCLRDLALHLSERDRDDEAADLLGRARLIERLHASRRAEGSEHPGTALACNELAVCLRRLGQSSQAEVLLREAVAIEARALPDDHPKRPHRLNNLASVLLMQQRWEESREVLKNAWRLQAGRRDLTCARILCLRFTLACAEGQIGMPFLGQLKSLASGAQLSAEADIVVTWDLGAVWESLQPHVPELRLLLIRRIAASLNDWRFSPRLDDDPEWSDAVAEALDTPWTEVGGESRVCGGTWAEPLGAPPLTRLRGRGLSAEGSR